MNAASRLLLLLPLVAGPALAQTRPAAPPAPATPAPAAPAPAPAPSLPTPERTLSSFGDWVVRCEQRPTGGRGCEMAQTSTDQRQQPVAVLALGRPARGEPLRLVAQVPVNITTSQAAQVTVDPALVLPFKSCTPRGCFAELELRDAAVLQRLRSRAAEAAARLEWRDAAGQDAGVAVSFRGFAAAFEALSRETE